MRLASGKMFSLTAWISIGQYSVRSPTTIERLILLRVNSSLDLFRFTLAQKDLVTAQLLVVNQRFLSWSEGQQSSNEQQEANGAPTRSHSAVIATKVPVLASSSALQFPAILLWLGIQTSLIIKQLGARDKESRHVFTRLEPTIDNTLST